MAWKDLDSDLEELFSHVAALPRESPGGRLHTKGELPTSMTPWELLEATADRERAYLYARVTRYLKTAKGKAALKRYQSQPHVLEARRTAHASYRERNREKERLRAKEYRAKKRAAKLGQSTETIHQ